MKTSIQVCVIYSRDLVGMPVVTHGSEKFREPQSGSVTPQTGKAANRGIRVKMLFKCSSFVLKIDSRPVLAESSGAVHELSKFLRFSSSILVIKILEHIKNFNTGTEQRNSLGTFLAHLAGSQGELIIVYQSSCHLYVSLSVCPHFQT